MMSGLFRFFREKNRKARNGTDGCETEERGPCLSQYVTYGAHLYREAGEVAEVIFFHKARRIRRVIVDDFGDICNFPGFAEPESICENLDGHELPDPRVRFRTSFQREPSGLFLMVWQVQPDGRYWEDEDGFCGESDEEVCLCSHIDEKGRFTHPFCLYSVGRRMFYTKPAP